MPKRTYKILNFHGGLNNDSDPRDIKDNQFVELQNVAIDKVGRIVVLGDIKTPHHTMAGDITTPGGRGLMALRTDYDGFADGDVGAGGGTYYVVENGAALNTESGADVDDAEAETAITVTNLAEASMYYVDGALRVYDADHSTSVTPQWRGYIAAKNYGLAGTDHDAVIAATWSTQSAQIAGAFETYESGSTGVYFCKNALVGNRHDVGGATVGGDGDDFSFYEFNNGTVDTLDADYNGGAVAEGASGQRWGVALEFDELADDTGTWMPTVNTRYKFYITTMYDDHTQESLPQLMQLWGKELLHDNTANAYVGETVQSEILFQNDNTDGTGSMVAVNFRPVFKFNYDTGTVFNFGASSVGASSGGNLRVSGVKIYWASNEDGYKSLYQMFDAKFDEGVSAIGLNTGTGGTLGYSAWATDPTFDEHASINITGNNRWVDPPKFISYSAANGHAPTEVISVDSFKTSVIANRRAYIGHIEQDGQIYGDRILKSSVAQFDKFPQDVGQLDVIVQDGDEIVYLAEFADRILQFKKSILYIINVSGAAEYLESEHRFKGVTNPGAVTKTDYGIAWANQNGCYLYDGQNVTDLLEDKGIRKISKSAWSDHIGDETDNYHRVGYNPKKRQIIVIAGADNSGAGYVFDLVTKGWVYGSSIVEDVDTGSNFINDPVGGDLLIYDNDGGKIDKWADTPAAAYSIIITTKDIDFGEPALNKNVYKVRVTYTGGTNQNLNITYAIDGSGWFGNFDADLDYDTNTTQQVADLTPASTSTTNIKSIQLKISGTAATTFELNDISIIYRLKGVR